MSRRLRSFKRWMRSHGIDCSDALELADAGVECGGISVHALCDLKEGDLVATIPKSACLTVRTSGASDLIEEAGLAGYLALAVAVMYERGLGPASPWHGYLKLLPERECLPIVWSPEEVENLLLGTELHKIVKEDKIYLYDDWKECIEPLTLAGPPELDVNIFGVEQYISAKTLVSSRSFQIDKYHGSGMVPLADLFNHKTGAENVHFTSECPPSSSDDEGDSNISNVSEDNRSSVVNSSSSYPGDDPAVLEMIVVRGVETGHEVFNTYGCMGNAALLHRYGFTEVDNEYDIVNIDLNMVSKWCKSSSSRRYTRARILLWRQLKFSGCFSENYEYFEVSFDGRPQLELLVLLYIFSLADDIYDKLGSLVHTFESADESTKLLNMIKIAGVKCRKIQSNKVPEDVEDSLMTENVCSALVALADMRESLYGRSSLGEDQNRLEGCSQVKDRKLYHSLLLRVCERRILAKLRAYASRWVKPKRRKRSH